MPDQSIAALPLPGSDVGGTIATTGALTLGTSIYGTIGVANDKDWYAISVVAGQTYDFRLAGVGRTPLPDTILELRDGAGGLLFRNDDFGGQDIGRNSILVFEATVTGTIYVAARGFGTNTGDFILTAVEHNAAGAVLTADEIAWQLTNNFERVLGAGSDENVPAPAYDVSGPREITYNSSALTAEGEILAVAALRMWADVTGITFVGTNSVAEIVFDDSDPGLDAYNSNVTTPDGTITSGVVQVTTGWLAEFGTTFDSYSFETYVHELGHALGLGHGGNYNGSAVYGVDNFYLNDSIHLSVMSYMQAFNDEFARGGGDFNTFSNAEFRWVLTPMIADILAMSNIYGLSTTTRTGNTIYGYGSNTGNAVLDAAVALNDPANDNYVAFTVFDNGGTDTINLSGFDGDQRIDLNEGASSDILGGRLNMGIAYGTVVERASGGAGDDAITGNAANNRLTGNDGADTLVGGGGVDTLIGGLGADVYLFDGLDKILEGLDAGRDEVFSAVSLRLGVNLEYVTLLEFATALNGMGNSLGNHIDGNSFANRLDGREGSDLILGWDGADILTGGLGRDTLTGGDGKDSFVFNAALGAGNFDIVTDFDAARERLRLDDAIFATLATGTLDAAAFIANATGIAAGILERIIYNTLSGEVFYDSDGAGGTAGTKFAELAPGLLLDESNFLVF